MGVVGGGEGGDGFGGGEGLLAEGFGFAALCGVEDWGAGAMTQALFQDDLVVVGSFGAWRVGGDV